MGNHFWKLETELKSIRSSISPLGNQLFVWSAVKSGVSFHRIKHGRILREKVSGFGLLLKKCAHPFLKAPARTSQVIFFKNGDSSFSLLGNGLNNLLNGLIPSAFLLFAVIYNPEDTSEESSMLGVFHLN